MKAVKVARRRRNAIVDAAKLTRRIKVLRSTKRSAKRPNKFNTARTAPRAKKQIFNDPKRSPTKVADCSEADREASMVARFKRDRSPLYADEDQKRQGGRRYPKRARKKSPRNRLLGAFISEPYDQSDPKRWCEDPY
jgi:hypothetical protein